MSPFVVGLVLLSALIHAVWSLTIKGSRDPLAFNLLQAVPLAIVCLVLPFFADLPPLSQRFFWLVTATGLAHAIYLYGLSLAFEAGDLSLVYPIARSAPAFLPLVAVPIAGERITWAGGLGIATVVAGMWAVQAGDARRRSDEPAAPPLRARLTARPVLHAYLALAASVAYGVIDKLLVVEVATGPDRGTLPPAILCFFAVWAGCAVFFVPMALARMRPDALRRAARTEWRTVLLAASIGVVGYSLILKALETDPASYVVAVRQASVFFVLILSVAFLRERPGGLRILGAVATVAGVALIALAG